jgi:hypothetical protein
VSARSADIIFLGSGEYNFTTLPPKGYVRPEATAAPSAPAPIPPPPSSSNKGVLIGCILGGVALAVVMLVVCIICAGRRRKRAAKMDSQGLVRKWEWERQQGAQPASRTANAQWGL